MVHQISVVERVPDKRQMECVDSGYNNTQLQSRRFPIWRTYRGLFFGGMYALSFSISMLIIKSLDHYPPTTISMWRNAATLFPTLVVFLIYQFKKNGNKTIFGSVFPINNRERALLAVGLLCRGIFGGLARLFSVCGQKYLTVGDYSIINSSETIVVICLASICLGEPCGFVLGGVALLTFSGIVLMSRPPILTGQTSFDINNLAGIGLAFAAVILVASVMTVLRRMRKVHWFLILLAGGLIGFLTNFFIAAALGGLVLPAGSKDSLLVYIAFPAAVFSSQISLPLAFKFEKAGPVALMLSSGIIFSHLLQFAAFGKLPDVYSWSGASLVTLGLIITTLRKWVEELPSEDNRRIRLRFLLK